MSKKDKEEFAKGAKIKKSARRIKLYIKLNQEESEHWSQFYEMAAQTSGWSEQAFAKLMFIQGIQSFSAEMKAHVEGLSDEDKEKIMSEATEEVVDMDDKDKPSAIVNPYESE